MNYPFNRNDVQGLRRIAILGAVSVLCAASLYGCGKKEPTPVQTEPSLNLVESTAPITETTAPPTTEAPKKDVAIVKEQLNVRAAPSKEGNIISQLDAGDEVEVLRVETINGTEWAYLRQGWTTTDFLDMSNVSFTQTPANGTPNNPGGTEPTDPPETTAPPTTATTAPAQNADGSSNNETNTDTTGNKMGVVIANGLNVRESDSTNSAIVGNLGYGERVAISETRDGWGKTAKGWVSLNYVYMDGTKGTNSCNGIVTGNAVNIRSGPGTGYGVNGSVSSGTRVNVLQRIEVGGKTWGCINSGWISMDYVYVDGTEVEDQSGTGTVTANAVNVRSGPGTNYASVGGLNSGDTIKIYAQFTIKDMTWGCTDKGWVCMDYVEMD